MQHTIYLRETGGENKTQVANKQAIIIETDIAEYIIRVGKDGAIIIHKHGTNVATSKLSINPDAQNSIIIS
jgi:hypothetical protein